jgi:hypothetical protein
MGKQRLFYTYKKINKNLSFTVQVLYRLYDPHNVSIGEVWDEEVAEYIVKLLNDNKNSPK